MKRAIFPGSFASTILVLCVTAMPGAAYAQGYPVKTIRYVVPFPPGGITDMMARTIGQKAAEDWKQAVVIDNRSGGNAMIGADLVAKSPPDGYTWLAMTITHTVNATLFPRAPYSFTKDLQAVSVLGSLPMIVVVPQSRPVNSLAELTALGRTRSLTGGSGGNGTPQHLGLELYRQLTGINARHIPFKGAQAPLIGLMGGDLDFVITALPEGLPHIKSGRLRGLAVTSSARHPLLAEVPTTAELGLSGLLITSWTGLMVPSGTPKPIVERINAEVASVLKQPDTAKRVREQGFNIVANSAGAAQSFMAAEVERWGKVVRDANIRAD